ncbi:hypothetical protein [uncultured Nitratireductor sp.]|uniref:hypothetical protein n=1 Tax=uncultured Nitratireductor sp. TaxID=520953 RepID=UPI0025FE578E|nr:hypothetical protein [uncultured Nitratireductor sp.]
MYVRVSSGGRVFLLAFIIIFPIEAPAADLATPDALERYRIAQGQTQRAIPRTTGLMEYRQSDGNGQNARESGRHSKVELSGRINRTFGADWNLQGSLKHERSELNERRTLHTQASAHLYWRNPQSHAVGAFAAVTETRGEEDAANSFSNDNPYRDPKLAAGFEAALFSDTASLLALAGVRTASLEEYRAESAFAGLGARYYASDQLRLGLRGTYERPLDNDNAPIVYGLDASVDYRPEALPFSTFGGYRYRIETVNGADGTTRNTSSQGIFAGFRYHFGSESLKQEERFGPLWPDLPAGL